MRILARDGGTTGGEKSGEVANRRSGVTHNRNMPSEGSGDWGGGEGVGGAGGEAQGKQRDRL
jgi:hypothetical protein